jgi:hypothetical protein
MDGEYADSGCAELIAEPFIQNHLIVRTFDEERQAR